MVIIDSPKFSTTLTDSKTAHFFCFQNESGSRDVQIRLEGVGSEAYVYMIFLGSNNTDQNIRLTVTHAAPHTTSRIIVLGILKDQAQSTVLGSIKIEPGSVKSVAREEIYTLLLSKDAKIRATPELNIANNDVQCGHAVTTTHIDEVKKFYLESRGMNENEVIKTIVYGHIAPIYDALGDETKQILDEKLKDFLVVEKTADKG